MFENDATINSYSEYREILHRNERAIKLQIDKNQIREQIDKFQKSHPQKAIFDVTHLTDSFPSEMDLLIQKIIKHEMDNTEMYIICELAKAYLEGARPTYPKPHLTCKDCRHRDPEDRKCYCGCLERADCYFPVSNDYYCKYAERREEVEELDEE